MIEIITIAGLFIALLLPLSLSVMLIAPRFRGLARRLIPIAALPALFLAALAAETDYTLPGFMIGETFTVDDLSRLFLLLGGALLSAAAVLTREDPSARGRVLSEVLLLLFITTTMMTIVAADALTYYAAVTVAGYALCGLLSPPGANSPVQANKVLVVLLVISDIAMFELLLLAGKSSSSLEFVALRTSLLETKGSTAIIAFMFIGIGIKSALVGVHFWLAPALVEAARFVRPLIISFVFCTGLLGWLRMLPLGVASWPDTGAVLQWLAWLMATYAIVTGLLQKHAPAVMAHILMLLTALWLATGGGLLATPGLLTALQVHWHFVFSQSVFAVGALLLSGRRRLFAASGLIGAVTLSLAPATLISGGAHWTGTSEMAFGGMGIGLALLSFRFLRLQRDNGDRAALWDKQQLAALLFAVAALLGATLGWTERIDPDAATGWMTALAFGALAGWYLEPMAKRFPSVPPGDAVVLIHRALAYLLRVGDRIGQQWLPACTQRIATLLQHSADPGIWSPRIRTLEAMLTRWIIGVFLLIIIGAAIAIAAFAQRAM